MPLDLSVSFRSIGLQTPTPAHFAAHLDAMEYGDQSGLSDDEPRGMCVMSLHDLKPVVAACLMLEHDMGDILREGHRRNLRRELGHEGPLTTFKSYGQVPLHRQRALARKAGQESEQDRDAKIDKITAMLEKMADEKEEA